MLLPTDYVQGVVVVQVVVVVPGYVADCDRLFWWYYLGGWNLGQILILLREF